MKMVPPLPLLCLGFSRFSKLVQPSLLGSDRRGRIHFFHISVQTVFSHEVNGTIPIGCFFEPSSQGRLCLLSGMPQRTMEPLKIATGFLPREILATAQKDFIVILGGATQLQLGGPTAFALQQTSFYFCPDLGMDVFFLVFAA